MEMIKIIVFDLKNCIDKNGNNLFISNSDEELLSILNGSPVILLDENEQSEGSVFGAITSVYRKTRTSLFYGNVITRRKIKKFEIVDQELQYDYISDDTIHITGIISYIKEVI